MPAFSTTDDSVRVRILTSTDNSGIDAFNRSLGSMSAKSVAIGNLLYDSFKQVTGSLVGVGKTAISSASSFEQSRVAFETMLGSADKARGLMQDISKFAKETPFELPEVVAGSKQLLAFGFAQEQIIPTMRKLGDIAAGVGVPVGQLTNVFGQVRVAGRLMGQDLLQFTNAGVPLIEMLAKTMGKPQEEIKKLVEKGQVGFADVERAINAMTNEGGKFGGMMQKQSQTFGGVVSNIKDGFGQMLRAAVGVTDAGDIVAGGVFDRIKGAAQKAMPQVQEFAQYLSKNMPGLVSKTESSLKGFWKALSGEGVTESGWTGKIQEFLSIARETAIQISDYLTPKLQALWNSINQDLVPAFMNLWENVIKPLLPILGTALVLAIGAVTDTINVLIPVLSSLINFISDNTEIVTGLAIAVGSVWSAMKVQEGIQAFGAGLNAAKIMIGTFQTAGLGSLQASLVGFAGWGLFAGAALAAFAVIMNKLKEIDAIISNTNKSIDTTENALNTAREQYKAGKITKERYNAILSDAYSSGDGVPKFRSGVENFEGGLAYVHQGEALVNLPKGTDVIKRSDVNKGAIGGGQTTMNFHAPIYLQTADAVNEFFKLQNENSMYASRGLGVAN